MSEIVLNSTQRDLLARAIGYGFKQPEVKLASSLYEKTLSTICDTLVNAEVVTDGHAVALKNDLRTKQAQLIRVSVTNIVTEMAHSMNRKALLENDKVEPFIDAVMEGLRNELG